MSDGHSSDGWGSGSSSWSGADGYGTSDPYSSSDPYGSSASSGAADPYAASDPYASPAPSASEFAPQFGSQQHAHQAAVPYAAPLQDPYGVPHPVGYAVAPPTSASAITGLVLGILSLTFGWGVPGWSSRSSACGPRHPAPSRPAAVAASRSQAWSPRSWGRWRCWASSPTSS